MTASSIVRPSTAIADPNNPSNVLVPNASFAAVVTQSNATVFAVPTIGVWVGGNGNVAVRMYGGQNSVTFTGVVAGTLLPIQVDKILATGTSSANIVRLW